MWAQRTARSKKHMRLAKREVLEDPHDDEDETLDAQLMKEKLSEGMDHPPAHRHPTINDRFNYYRT